VREQLKCSDLNILGALDKFSIWFILSDYVYKRDKNQK